MDNLYHMYSLDRIPVLLTKLLTSLENNDVKGQSKPKAEVYT